MHMGQSNVQTVLTTHSVEHFPQRGRRPGAEVVFPAGESGKVAGNEVQPTRENIGVD